MDPDRSSLLHDTSLPKLVRDQLADKPELRPFRAHPPSTESYLKAIEEREKKGIDRELLARQLHRQYEKDGVAANPSTQAISRDSRSPAVSPSPRVINSKS